MPCYRATAVAAMAFAAITSTGISGTIPSVSAFAPPSNPTTVHHTNRRLPAPLRLADDDPLSDMTDERKANVFQALLRDLQIENVPLLGCDANQVHTLNAALWTTMTEMNDSDDEQRACLVLEDIPVSALVAFAEDFTVLKTQDRLMQHLPELKRFSISPVGKGVGPALLIETAARVSDEDRGEAARRRGVEAAAPSRESTEVALRSFVERVVVGMEACPYTKSADVSGVGLEKQGVKSGPVGYRYSNSADVCGTMAAFWNSACEMMGADDAEIGSILLSLPAVGGGRDGAAFDRFTAVVELVGRYLCLFRGDSVFGLVHFHPAYDRSAVVPDDMPAYGHLPPMSWLRPILKMSGQEEAASTLTDEQLSLSNYQRRAPHAVINILRMSQVNAAAGPKSIVDLDLGNGRVEKASGITLYSRNAVRLVGAGEEALRVALDGDIALQQ